jgi:hypothetical protein
MQLQFEYELPTDSFFGIQDAAKKRQSLKHFFIQQIWQRSADETTSPLSIMERGVFWLYTR